MFLSMMFERSLKSNIDGIEHSLTFDQKKLAFEIMTSAFFFSIYPYVWDYKDYFLYD